MDYSERELVRLKVDFFRATTAAPRTSHMKDIDATNRLRHPWRVTGLLLALFFGLKLLFFVHLPLFGKLVPGYTGRVAIEELTSAEDPVLYVYQVGEQTHHGWRRGLEWGKQEITVVYSPAMPRYHFIAVAPRMTSTMRLWGEIDFLLRVFLLAGGTAIGLGLVVWAEKVPSSLPRGWTFLPGLDQNDT